MTNYSLVKDARDRLSRLPAGTTDEHKAGILCAEFPTLVRGTDAERIMRHFKRVCAAYRV